MNILSAGLAVAALVPDLVKVGKAEQAAADVAALLPEIQGMKFTATNLVALMKEKKLTPAGAALYDLVSIGEAIIAANPDAEGRVSALLQAAGLPA